MDQAALNGLCRKGTELVWQAQDVTLGNVSLLAVVHKEHPPASFRLLHQLPAVPATTRTNSIAIKTLKLAQQQNK